MRQEIDWPALPADTPDSLRALLQNPWAQKIFEQADAMLKRTR